MVLTIKNFTFSRFTEKSDFQGGVQKKKNNIEAEGGVPNKGVATWTIC